MIESFLNNVVQFVGISSLMGPWFHKYKTQIVPNLVVNRMVQPHVFPVEKLNCNATLQEMITHFSEHGFLVIKGLIPPDVLDECSIYFHNILRGQVDSSSLNLVRDLDNNIVEIENIFHIREFNKYTQHSLLLKVVEHVTGPNIMGVCGKMINKSKGALLQGPHQNHAYVPSSISPDKSVVCWTAMEESVVDNGCHYVVPRTHRGILYQANPNDQGNAETRNFLGLHNIDELMPESTRVDIIMEKGDTLFIHPVLVHGVGPNADNGPINAVTCHFANADEKVFETFDPPTQAKLKFYGRKSSL